jgi:hypothetical protein
LVSRAADREDTYRFLRANAKLEGAATGSDRRQNRPVPTCGRNGWDGEVLPRFTLQASIFNEMNDGYISIT